MVCHSLRRQYGHQCLLFEFHFDAVSVWCDDFVVCMVSRSVVYGHHGGTSGVLVNYSSNSGYLTVADDDDDNYEMYCFLNFDDLYRIGLLT